MLPANWPLSSARIVCLKAIIQCTSSVFEGTAILLFCSNCRLALCMLVTLRSHVYNFVALLNFLWFGVWWFQKCSLLLVQQHPAWRSTTLTVWNNTVEIADAKLNDNIHNFVCALINVSQWMSEDVTPRILTFGVKQRWAVSITLQPFHPQRKP
jgi:hypothetical protein